jgi:hypothetical protein
MTQSANNYQLLYQFSTSTYNSKQISWTNAIEWQTDPLLVAEQHPYTATPLSAKKFFRRDTRLDPKS